MSVSAKYLLLLTLATACVDGTTPNCTAVDSGCYPTDASSQPDVGDASSDVSLADASTG